MDEPKARDAHIFERDPLDWYVEDQRVTRQLLSVEDFYGEIHDPCCGGGNIVKACLAAGLEATGTDVVRRMTDDPSWFLGELDFLTSSDALRIDNLIMNPPYFGGKGTEAFIRKGLAVARRKVAVFVDRRFVTGKGRAAGLYRDHPPAWIWEVTPRPSCPPGAYLAAGGKASGGTADFCWLVWDRECADGTSRHGWLVE
jgi:hypothetical protein